MTIIHDEETHQFSARIPLFIFLGVFLLIGGGLTTFLVLRSRQPDAHEVAAALTDQARQLFDQERYQEVVSLLQDQLSGLVEREDVDGLRLFADACLKCPLENNRHLGASAEIYRRILGFSPEDVESARRLTEIYSSAGKTEDAIKYAEISLQQQPERIDWRLQLADLFAQQSRYQRSLDIVDDVLVGHPQHRPALQQRIQTMVDAAASEDEIRRFLDSYSGQPGSEQLRAEMRLMHANIVGDQDVALILYNTIADAEPEDEDHARWLASVVTPGQDVRRTAELQARIGDTTQNWKPVIYRYLQQNDFEKVESLLQEHIADADSEVLLIQFLARWMSGTGDLSEPLTRLSEQQTQVSRSWLPVLTALQEKQSAAAVLTTCDAALETFPGSPWLHLIRAQSLVSLGEFDLAAQTYRMATRANPQWFQVRIELSRLRLQQADFATAFGEAVTAIRAQPESTVGYELAMVSALRAAEAGQPLSDAALGSLTTALDNLREATTDSFSQLILPIVIRRLSDRPNISANPVRDALQQTDLSGDQLEILRLLCSDQEVLAEIDQRMSDLQGMSIREILSHTLSIASTQGLPQVADYLEQLRVDGEPLPEVSRRLLYAQTVSVVDPAAGANVWLAIASDFPDNARVLGAAIRSSAVRADRAICRKVIGLLKEATSDDSVLWQLEEIRLQLDEEQSEKVSSAVALRLVDLIQKAPDCADAYELMAIAMERLGRQDKVYTTLKTAVTAGIKRPTFTVRLAEIAVENGKPAEAVQYATMAAGSDRPTLLRRAAGVLLTCEEFAAAADALETVCPAELIDQDEDFATMTGLSVAWARLGKIENVVARLQPLAVESDRWFQLWVDVSVLESVSENDSQKLLTEAEVWTKGRSVRLRRLAGAWRKLAGRSNNEEFWSHAREAIRQVAADEITTGDRLVLCGLHERLGDEGAAAAIYEDIASAGGDKQLRAIALNNLALIDARTGRYQMAEKRVREAIELAPRPEFADSLASIFADQEQIPEAVDLLIKSRDQWPESVKLQARLRELQKRL